MLHSHTETHAWTLHTLNIFLGWQLSFLPVRKESTVPTDTFSPPMYICVCVCVTLNTHINTCFFTPSDVCRSQCASLLSFAAQRKKFKAVTVSASNYNKHTQSSLSLHNLTRFVHFKCTFSQMSLSLQCDTQYLLEFSGSVWFSKGEKLMSSSWENIFFSLSFHPGLHWAALSNHETIKTAASHETHIKQNTLSPLSTTLYIPVSCIPL